MKHARHPNPIIREWLEMILQGNEYQLTPLEWYETMDSDMSGEAVAYTSEWTLEHRREAVEFFKKWWD